MRSRVSPRPEICLVLFSLSVDNAARAVKVVRFSLVQAGTLQAELLGYVEKPWHQDQSPAASMIKYPLTEI